MNPQTARQVASTFTNRWWAIGIMALLVSRSLPAQVPHNEDDYGDHRETILVRLETEGQTNSDE